MPRLTQFRKVPFPYGPAPGGPTLDMNMPKLTGLEVLREIPDSAELPVCVLTSSQSERNLIEQHFAPKKVSYLTKPVDAEQLLDCFRCHDHLRPVAEQLAKQS